MSALTPHIRVLRQLETFLSHEVDAVFEMRSTDPSLAVRQLLKHLTRAISRTVAQLEAEEAALKTPRDGLDEAITFNPKGKTTK